MQRLSLSWSHELEFPPSAMLRIYQRLWNFFISSMDCLTLRNEFCMNNAPDVKETNPLCHRCDFATTALWVLPGVGEPHWRCWHSFSRSYWKTHGSSPLTLFLKNVPFVQLSLKDKDKRGIHLFHFYHSKMCGAISMFKLSLRKSLFLYLNLTL